MNWKPSVLEFVQLMQPDTKERKDFTYIQQIKEIYAGNVMDLRPVFLVSMHANELIEGELANFFQLSKFSLAPKESLIIVDPENEVVHYKDINEAIKDSLKAEKEILHRGISSEKTDKIVYISTKKKRFFISPLRLLGEIVKAQRKIERMRSTTKFSPATHKSMECFLKKLCIIKVLADRETSQKTQLL